MVPSITVLIIISWNYIWLQPYDHYPRIKYINYLMYVCNGCDNMSVNGRENTSSFLASSFGPENNGQNSTQNKATMVNRPPPPFIMNGGHPERPPRRPAQSISSEDSGERSVAARWSWAAQGLSSGRFAVAGTCFCTVWGRILEVPRQSTG